ncbi:hypothetical protein TIFTF001_017041 [Ficus carica]|uniref:F-box domain-containing protein n=1 Tax=Ficus carica TaxID=3494 RepID=A0AA88A7D1_FICCA|nr:hypothetical protein TIFTF001_017041 [Ficus carica]
MGNRRTRKENKNEIQPPPDLPESVLKEIFARLPQECLAELRYVCKCWHQLISWNRFVADSFHKSSPGLLVQVVSSCRTKSLKTKLLEFDSEGIRFRHKPLGMSRMGKARSNCNGLLLVNDMNEKKSLVVMNVLTKCYLTLPHCPSHCPHRSCGLALVFNPHEKVYRVVHVYNADFGFEIFTLGCSENEWKVIPGPFSGPHDRPFDEMFRWSDPLSTNGQLILHWDVASRKYLISFDTCEERFKRTKFPCSFDKGTGTLLEKGGNLSFVHRSSSTQFDVWVLEGFEDGVWNKSFCFKTESMSYMSPNINALPSFENLVPALFISLRDGEVMIFQHKSSPCWYLYETKHRVLRKLPGMPTKNPKLLTYKSSLISWKNKEELFAREII